MLIKRPQPVVHIHFDAPPLGIQHPLRRWSYSGAVWTASEHEQVLLCNLLPKVACLSVPTFSSFRGENQLSERAASSMVAHLFF